jgi:hypothetical protein
MISINQIYATTIVQKLGLYCSSYLGNDLYYLKEAIMLMVNLYGEERLVEMLKSDDSPNKKVTNKMGEEWFLPNGMKKKLEKISKILEKTNKSYIALEDRKLKKKTGYSDFIKQCSEVPKIENDFYALFVFLVENSSIKSMNLTSQHLKIIDTGKSFGSSKLEERKFHEINKL